MKKRKIIDMSSPIDYNRMWEILDAFSENYEFLSFADIGKSIFDRRIPVIRFGEGEKKILYIGAHHGSEWITSGLLLRFVNELSELYRSDGQVAGIRISELFNKVELNILPMLNPDGVELSQHGLTEDNIMFSRLLTMNKGSLDFTHWQANGRGVDLNHNYNYGFEKYKGIERESGIENGASTRYSGEHPESEPESAYLCNYIRFCGEFSGVLTLHTQGEEIYYKSGDRCPQNAEKIAKYFSQISGYALGKAEGAAAYGGFTDWFINEFDRPSFTIECGKGSNPLPLSDLSMIYIRIRRMLFEAPLILARQRS